MNAGFLSGLTLLKIAPEYPEFTEKNTNSFSFPNPFLPRKRGRRGQEGGVAGGFAARHTPTQNPPSWGEGGQGEWADRNTNILSYRSTWHTKVYAKPGIGNKWLRQVY